MAIRLLVKHGIYTPNTVATLDAATEASLIAAKLATANLMGGVQYLPPVIPRQHYPVLVELDPARRAVGVVGGPNEQRYRWGLAI